MFLKSLKNKITRDHGLAFFSGLLLNLIFPRINLSIAAWIALVPLLISLKNKTPMEAFWLGEIAGFTFFVGVIQWITNTMINYGHLPAVISYMALILLSLYLSLYVGLFCYLLNKIGKDNPLLKIALAPLLWTVLEFGRTYSFLEFPWAILGYSQFKNITLIQFTDITGVYGLTFMIIWVNATIAYLIADFKKFTPSILTITALPLIILITTYTYGLRKTINYDQDRMKQKEVKVSVIQGNIEQDMKWDRKYQQEVFETYQSLSLQSGQDNPQLIIWPETATPFYFQEDQYYRTKMFNLARKTGAYILFGSPTYQRRDDQVTLFNSSFLISPEGKIVSQYDKMHLVPFGEYVPMGKFLFFVQKMVEGIGDFGRGKDFTIMDTNFGKISVLICYEIIFPDLARTFVHNGATFLANITNDAWFGKSAASYQHISFATFRAVENGVPIVRAANTGISAIIDPLGRFHNETDLFVATRFNDTIYPKTENSTLYNRYGDVFAYLCIGFIILLIAINRNQKKC